MLKQTLVASVMTMGMFAGTAYAHVEQPVTGDAVNFIEGALSWNGSNTIATGTGTTGNNNIVAFDFSVFTAGSVDIFGNDRDSVDATNTSIYVFKHDTVADSWNIAAFSSYGDIANLTTPPSANNIYGVPMTGWFDVNTPGNPEAGLTTNLSKGNYMAMLVSSQGAPLELVNTGLFTGSYADGWSWLYATGVASEIYAGLAPYDLTIRVASGSSAVIGATPPHSEVPVPAAAWLMGSVLAGFCAFSRKKATIVA
jgi:hypothetical protein